MAEAKVVAPETVMGVAAGVVSREAAGKARAFAVAGSAEVG